MSVSGCLGATATAAGSAAGPADSSATTLPHWKENRTRIRMTRMAARRFAESATCANLHRNEGGSANRLPPKRAGGSLLTNW